MTKYSSNHILLSDLLLRALFLNWKQVITLRIIVSEAKILLLPFVMHSLKNSQSQTFLLLG